MVKTFGYVTPLRKESKYIWGDLTDRFGLFLIEAFALVLAFKITKDKVQTEAISSLLEVQLHKMRYRVLTKS